MDISIIGFGEAGPVFAAELKAAGMTVTAYDKLQNDPKAAMGQKEKTQSAGILLAQDIADALQKPSLVISTVTASEATAAAKQAAPSLKPGTHWLDLNSVSPDTKKEIADIVTACGAEFTEGVAMDTVPSKGAQVPLLLCGPHADQWSVKLNDIGFNTKCLGSDYGMASTTKLLRSVIIKGMESLFAESMEAAGIAGVEHEVLLSIKATYPELDWESVAGYQLSRSVLHAERRASEMREAARLVKSLGLTPLLSQATAQKQQELADRNLKAFHRGTSVADFIHTTKTGK